MTTVGGGWLQLGPDDPFGLQTMAFGAVAASPGDLPEPCVRVGGFALPLAPSVQRFRPDLVSAVLGTNLDRFLVAGPETWRELQRVIEEWFTDERFRPYLEPLLVPLDEATMHLPFTVSDYVDFYASEHHATRVGTMFRPGQPPLPPSWKHLPIGYHGRAGTVVVSGTDVVRPCGQFRDHDTVVFGPTRRLDFEAEVGWVVGVGSERNAPVALEAFPEHVFGAMLLNDWSARDIQSWEYVPLGPMLGKSFATSVSGWVTPLSSLGAARVAPPPRDPAVPSYLDDDDAPWGFDIAIEIQVNGDVVARTDYASMYWSPAQMLAHLTVNGASTRTGDLFGSGTVSGPSSGECGCLLELTANGTEPITLSDGSERGFLHDGDVVTMTASAPGPSGSRVGLGEVTAEVRPAFSPLR